MIYIPKYITFNNLELKSFWDDKTIHKYIVAKIKEESIKRTLKDECVFKYYKSFIGNQTFKLNFDIITKKYKSSRLLSFFEYKKLHYIMVNSVELVKKENKGGNFTIFDLKSNPVKLLDCILNSENMIYKGELTI